LRSDNQRYRGHRSFNDDGTGGRKVANAPRYVPWVFSEARAAGRSWLLSSIQVKGTVNEVHDHLSRPARCRFCRRVHR
jgi:hypothetical protein